MFDKVKLHQKICLVTMSLFVAFFLQGCNQNILDQNKPEQKIHFSVYLVSGYNPFEAVNIGLDKLTLESPPLVSDTDIVEYDWSNHEFKLAKNVLAESLNSKVPTVGKPFVIVANGERIYLGAFWIPISSVSPPDIPIISAIFQPENEPEIYQIIYMGKGQDPRIDTRIYKALKDAGIIKE